MIEKDDYRKMRYKEAVEDARVFVRITEKDLRYFKSESEKRGYLISAYENKLKHLVDPDSKEWIETFDKLKSIQEEKERYDRLAAIEQRFYVDLAKGHLSGLLKGIESSYFNEWLRTEIFYGSRME